MLSCFVMHLWAWSIEFASPVNYIEIDDVFPLQNIGICTQLLYSGKTNLFCRSVLRENRCLEVLLGQLKSPSLTIVSNACGTLWNFSARDPVDQEQLWSLGAVPMLKSLTNSKHKTISTCSLAALKNLYAASSTASQVRKNPSNILSYLD